jgi:non-lysosomal glucosylceramidase
MANSTKKNGKSGRKRGRRTFLKGIALGAGTLSAAGKPEYGGGSQPYQETPATPAQDQGSRIEYPRVFSGARRRMLSFPLGGVGAGSISLGGRGQLQEWWIFNRPDKGNSPDYAFPSIWVQSRNAKPIARVLEARLLPPYDGPSGLGSANVPGLPRLQTCTFTGEFPLARVDFTDSRLPVTVFLEAFTPFIPLQAEDSGLPGAVLRYHVSNPAESSVSVSITFSAENPVGKEGRTNEYRKVRGLEGLLMRNPFLAATDPLAGTFALAVLAAETGGISYLRGWPSASWWEGPLLFWDDFSADGKLNPQAPARSPVGSVCLQREIPAGGSADYTFLLSWHFPNRTSKRCGWQAPKGRENDVIGNHYCTRFGDAWKVAEYLAERLPDLEARTRQFVLVMRQTTLPGAVKDAATANLPALVSPTAFRSADGGFHGFEGCHEQAGCCFGSCTHVWNYEAATAHLFPTLSRSFRERQFSFLTDADGRMDFRELLPGGLEHWSFAAADGQMGTVMKLYLDWRLSGDTQWLRRLWPTAKRALEFAWIPGGWDANRDGVMEGVQHNTYDVEFIGPNPLCSVWYLGALRAGEEMARAVGDPASAEEYRRLFHQGGRWIDANLFNGEFYIQKVGAVPRDQIAQGLRVGMGAGDPEHPTFQVGDGCLVDQLVGQYLAHIAGLGLLLDRDHIRTCLESIYKYNFRRSLDEHESVQRTYALNDESGLVVCDYSRGTRPETPFPYFAEIWTGLEYSVAALMIFMGMVNQGIEVIENARRRYDGERRNAWGEAECGYYYARPMASWAAVLALSGFRYNGAEKSVVAQPRIYPEKFFCFWSAATAWGAFAHTIDGQDTTFSMSVMEGELTCRSVTLAGGKGAPLKSSASLGTRSLRHEVRRETVDSTFWFAEEVTLKKGDRLSLAM